MIQSKRKVDKQSWQLRKKSLERHILESVLDEDMNKRAQGQASDMVCFREISPGAKRRILIKNLSGHLCRR